MTGKVVLITGASAGIGKETAIELLDQGAKVIVASRNQEKSIAVINKSINFQNGISYSLDLSSYQSVIEFSEKIKNDFPEGIDILINNAGQAFSYPELTNDKIEKSIQTNHLGHVILTSLLIKLIKKNGKIINVSSRGHKNCRSSTIDNLEKDFEFNNLNDYFECLRFYCFTKLCNVFYAKFLAKNYPHLISVSLHPGVVYSEIWDKTEGLFNFLLNCVKPISFIFMKNEKMGAQTTLYLSYEENENINNGGYYKDCKEMATGGLTQRPGTDKRLMLYTKNIIEKYFKDLPEDLKEHLEIIGKMKY
jgi:NAD(P)-dependent dehydrogenase (short-subunit alcohol dehydrogenase family)